MHQELLSRICVRPTQTMADAIRCIEASNGQICLVTDETGRLLGSITDGDTRRALLRGLSIEATAFEIMNRNPRWLSVNASREDMVRLMRLTNVSQLPLLSRDHVVTDILFSDDLNRPAVSAHPVVIMAGGLGTRLRPLTDDRPKPMIEVGGKPILETIISRFQAAGFRDLYICLNYRADMIASHFEDGSKFGVNITYVHEEKRLGTAGALSLVPGGLKNPAIVMNGDILTTVNFEQLLNFHYENEALATMTLNTFQYQLEYGVVDVAGDRIIRMTEKPVQKFFVNAGIYVISPDAAALIPSNEFFDMPSLFEKLPVDRRAAFPLHEYWLDIGRKSDLDVATREYADKFPSKPALAALAS